MPSKNRVRAMFNSISGDYDKLNHILSLQVDKAWRSRSIRKDIVPVLRDGATILDLACGTGDYSIAVVREALRHGLKDVHVHGADLSEGMLAVMKEKVIKEGLEDAISMNLADGEALLYGANTFDCLSIAFGIRNFEDRAKGLSEMFRVLRPGGKLVVLELSMPTNPLLRWVYNIYFNKILPAIGGVVSGNKGAYRYLPGSVIRFPVKEHFIKELQDAGFVQVRHKAYSAGLCRQYTGFKP